MQGFYDRMREKRKDSSELATCVSDVVDKLNTISTTSDRPGMLLGKIQSGKTRAFVGVIAAAFDDGYDAAIVLTKGTKSLSSQTVSRLKADFKKIADDDDFIVFDIMRLPDRLTKNELSRKIIFVAKKQIHNIQRLIELVDATEKLRKGRILLVDDEADLAGVRFTRERGTQDTVQGKIAQAIDDLRQRLKRLAVLQVTATPYSLYLQPEEYTPSNRNFVYKPKRPAFTVLLPIHEAYVGGDDYFGAFDPTDYRTRLFKEVADTELDALRREDKRRISQDRVLDTDNTAGIRLAIVTFVLAVNIRRWQQQQRGDRKRKYSMVIHNDTQRASHSWQKKVIEWIFEAILATAAKKPVKLKALFDEAYEDLSASVSSQGGEMPDSVSAFKAFIQSLNDEDFTLENVNSDNDVAALLDENSELMLRTPGNIFVGGNILDRGITVPSLISFYYGRNPRVMQADTVLQHSRMYGSRPREDLAVTRFFTSQGVHDRLFKINAFENALRHAFERGDDKGVVFIQTDPQNTVRPCAPNKILLSDVVAVEPGHTLLPTSFDTIRGRAAAAVLRQVTQLIDAHCPKDGTFCKVGKDVAEEIIDLISETLEFPVVDFEWQAMKSMIDYFENAASRGPGFVELIRFSGRKLDRLSSGDRTGLSILGSQTVRKQVLEDPQKHPALVLLGQDGSRDLNWAAGTPFWWPILAPPPGAKPVVFASKVAK